jgi:hypothetical protein
MFEIKEYKEGWNDFRNADEIDKFDEFTGNISNTLWITAKNRCQYNEYTNEYKLWEQGWWDSAAAYNHNAGGDW